MKNKCEPISDRELENQYREMLNEVYGTVKICGLEYDAAKALEDVDPVEFRCGFSDWISAELDDRLIEVDGQYFSREEFENED